MEISFPLNFDIKLFSRQGDEEKGDEGTDYEVNWNKAL